MTKRIEYPELYIEQVSDDWYARLNGRFVRVRGHRCDISVYGSWLHTFVYTAKGKDSHRRYFIVEAITGLCMGEYWTLKKAYFNAFGSLVDLGDKFGEKIKTIIARQVAKTGMSPRYKNVTPEQLDFFGEVSNG